MLKIQGKDFGNYCNGIELQLVRTYKGDINRTQTGKIAAFPTNFITVGFALSFLGPREVIEVIEQILLSDNTVEFVLEYKQTALKGKFSCTSNSSAEARDKNDRSKSLTVSIVSDGTDIVKPDGTRFIVKKEGTSAALKADCAFGKVYSIPGGSGLKLDGAYLPSGKLLVLGDTVLTT